MTSQSFEQMKARVGFGPEDEAALCRLAPVVMPRLNHIVAQFYDGLARDPQTSAVIEAHSSRERLSETLHGWLVELVTGPWDEAYRARRQRIGAVHERIGLPPHYVFTAMNVLRLGLLELADAGQQAAVNKVLDMELAIINQAYWEAMIGELQRRERLATIGELAGSFAHEIRNPLGAMQNAAYFLRRQVVNDRADPRIERHLDLLVSRVDECNRLVGSLLEFARMRTPEVHTVPAYDLVAQALADLPRPDGVALVIEPVEPGLTVRGDPMQLAAVLRNLVTNAVQAMQPTGEVRIRVARHGSGTRFQIADDGPGIAPENAADIFRPLVTTKTYGLGLGLPYCRRVAEQHGGRLSLESAPGAGATFTLEVPG